MSSQGLVLPPQTINARIPEVVLELGNRADLTSQTPPRVSLWLRNAYMNLCMAYNFEGLEYTYITQATSTSTIPFPTQARAIKSLIITDASGSTTYPDFKDIQTVRRMQSSSNSPSIPSVYTLFGTQLIFSAPFDANVYTVTLDLWQRPLITKDIISTPLLLPDDWFEALDYMAMMRGHALLGETDKSMALQRLLYGHVDPTSGQYVAGMLYNLQTRKQANAPARDYGLQPRSSRVKY